MKRFLYLVPVLFVLIPQHPVPNIKTKDVVTGKQWFVIPSVSSLLLPAKQVTDTFQLKQSNWYNEAMKTIAQKEYQFSWSPSAAAWSTPNRRNNLQFFYTEKGFTVQPKNVSSKTTKWEVAFKTDKQQVGSGAWQILANKAEYITDKVTVQYINNEEGMRQNFIVHSPLQNDEQLKLKFGVETTLQPVVTKNNIRFLNNKKQTVLSYEQLKVWDVNGNILDAAFEKEKDNYSIVVNTTNAVYPITIDPLSITPAAVLESNLANAQLGTSISSAGDVNGDGYSDVLIGAANYSNGQASEGAVFIYHGSITGLNAIPAITLESNEANARMGAAVSTAGDINRDGYSDILIGAPAYSSGEVNEGVVFVYHGSPTGITATPAAILESNQPGAQLGTSVACAGDVNKDGYSDIIAGAQFYDNGQTDEGAAFVYHGSSTGIITIPATTLESNQADAQMGVAVAGAGDVNGDGYSDVLAGAYLYDNGQVNEGAAFVYHGSPAGLNTTPVTMLQSDHAEARLGIALSCAGDVNGDGYSDVIMGVYLYDSGENDEGVASVYHGSAAGIIAVPVIVLESNQAGAQLGTSVACAGDVNGDGYSDVMAGAPLFSNGEANEGVIAVYYGSATGVMVTPAAVYEGNQVGAHIGASVSSAGDINGDGYSDIIAGANQYSNGEANEGAVFLYTGSAAGTTLLNSQIIEPNTSAGMGASVASAGDVNGDGYTDVIVGATSYSNGQISEGAAFIFLNSPTGLSATPSVILQSNVVNGQLGISVAGAGDINGDGYSDIIAGAAGYTNGQAQEGAAYIHYGSLTGISATPSVFVESNLASARMGYDVSGAGDINNDGYADVLIGVPGYTNGQASEGAVYVHYGSATGISATPSIIIQSNRANTRLGTSVSYAGDVNGDGFGDIISGAQTYSNGESGEGAAYIFHGSSTGVSATPAVILESNQANASMGWFSSGAGDVNGDGYSDVIVGAPFYDNGQTDEGVVFVYHGSSTGIGTSPSVILEPNQANASMGFSVSGAGDVNGDGYSDVITCVSMYDNGEVDEGAAFIYYGSSTGLNNTVSAILEFNQSALGFATSAAGVGDINRDGYSDVMVGMNGYSNGQAQEGAVLLYNGNNPGNGMRNNLSLYNTNLTSPVNSTNFTNANFGAGLFAKSFIGRDSGKLVWQTRANYSPFSGVPITNSTLFSAEQNNFTDLGLTGIELKNLVPKETARYTKLRARVQYDPVTALTGQVYGPWRYVQAELLGIQLGTLPLDLLSFKASWLQKGKTAQLTFTTDNESNLCCFDIQKSVDGISFVTIGTIPANNRSGIQTYRFTDDNATSSKQYYRIKMTNSDGSSVNSNILLLQHNMVTEIIVFPNPTPDVLQLQLNGTYAKLNIQIISASGQLAKQLNLSSTNQIIRIPVQELKSGVYWLHLQGGGEKQVLQFVKQ